MSDESPDLAHYDARVEEVQLVVKMAEGLYEGLDPAETGAQRLHVLLTECRQRVNDLRHQQHLEATADQPAPGSEHFRPGLRTSMSLRNSSSKSPASDWKGTTRP